MHLRDMWAGVAVLLVAAGCGGSAAVVRITTTDPLPEGIVGEPYSFVFEAAGGNGHEWTGVEVPFGSIAPDGTFTGVPPAAGTYEITVRVRAGSATDQWPFHFEIYEQLVTTLDDPPYLLGRDGADIITAVAGGKPPYSCSHEEAPGMGSLPAGVSLDAATCGLIGEASTEVPGSYGAIVSVEDELGQSVDIPVFYEVGACDTDTATLTPAASPAPAISPGSESSWLLDISDMDTPCIDGDCTDCQACYGVSFPTAAPVGTVPGLNCSDQPGVCYECIGCINLEPGCPGGGTMAPTFRITPHEPVRDGPAWISFSVLIDYTGADVATCSGKSWRCHISVLEM